MVAAASLGLVKLTADKSEANPISCAKVAEQVGGGLQFEKSPWGLWGWLLIVFSCHLRYGFGVPRFCTKSLSAGAGAANHDELDSAWQAWMTQCNGFRLGTGDNSELASKHPCAMFICFVYFA